MDAGKALSGAPGMENSPSAGVQRMAGNFLGEPVPPSPRADFILPGGQPFDDLLVSGFMVVILVRGHFQLETIPSTSPESPRTFSTPAPAAAIPFIHAAGPASPAA